MRALDALIRLRRDALIERHRALAELDSRRAAVARRLAALQASVEDEQRVAAGSLEALYAYRGFADRVIAESAQHRAALRALDASIDQAREALSVAFGELKKFEIAREQRARRERRARAQAEQKELDELALTRFRHVRHDPRQGRG